ncbi:MAG: ribulokinase [Clostridia bacterium]|nr:ribulokinase [Clostridia bacterium]
MNRYTIGIDFGTLSGRAVLMDVQTGEVLASSVYTYPHAVIDEKLNGKILPINTALQHPEDYLGVLQTAIRSVLREADVSPEEVIGLGYDFTGCTMLPVDKNATPLCFFEQYQNEPNAYVKLWKHNACQKEADDCTKIAVERNEPWLDGYGGKISAEWMIPKILQILRESPKVYHDTERFLEAADWLTWILTDQEVHSIPFAGYKALWNEVDGYPTEEYFASLDLEMKNIVGTKLSKTLIGLDGVAGKLSQKGAELTGLPVGTPISVPLLDAHASMPAVGLTDEGSMMLILGTSSVLMLQTKEKKKISGICGSVLGGVIPGLYMHEAGSACCGDHFDWFVKNSVPAAYEIEAQENGIGIHQLLTEKASKLAVGESGLLALDWFNGNRCVLSDSDLKGMILGMTLRTRPEEIYRALIEATAYGTRVIVDNFVAHEMRVDRIVASGGIAEKNEMLVQIYADVLGRPITVSDATMSASRGSALYAAVAGGAYEDIREAVRALAVTTGKTYHPIEENVKRYDTLYEEYLRLHDYFGRGENDVMHRLSTIAKQAAGN